MVKTYVLGLTGGIASGKSTIAKLFKEKGISLIDADEIAHELMLPHENNWNQIVAEFGSALLRDDETIDRQLLGEIVFNNEAALNKLNQLTHPTIKENILKQIKLMVEQEKKVVVVDIPLLFEEKFEKIMDATLLIYVADETQVKRLRERDGIKQTVAEQKIATQIPLSEKRLLADYSIDNTGTIEETNRLFEVFFSEHIIPLLEE